MNLTLNNLKWFICHKTKPNKNKSDKKNTVSYPIHSREAINKHSVAQVQKIKITNNEKLI